MKKIFTLLVTLTPLLCLAQDKVIQADTLCQKNNFQEATTIYEEIISSGQENAKIYYNLAYAYYKQGLIGKAALNFERAKRLAPDDNDTKFNLEQIYLLTDKVEVIEPFFLIKWWNIFADFFSSDGWAILFLILFAITLLGIAFFLFSDIVALRKTGFFSAICFVIFSIISISISLNKRNNSLNSTEAIIMSPSTTLSTSPDKYGSEMAVLHEGTFVFIVSYLGEWCQVMLKDGNIGWIKAKDLELI